MFEVFDNHVKQTLSHSSVIRNFTLLKTPQRGVIGDDETYMFSRSIALGLTVKWGPPTTPAPLHSAAISGVPSRESPGAGAAFLLSGRRAWRQFLSKAHKTNDGFYKYIVFRLKKKFPGSSLALGQLGKIAFTFSPAVLLSPTRVLVMVLFTLGKWW